MPEVDIVQNHTQDVASRAHDGLLDTLEHGARKPPVLDHDDYAVKHTGQNGCIAHSKDRRAIKDQHVEAILGLLDEVNHLLRIQNSDRFRRQSATWQQIKVLNEGRLNDFIKPPSR